MPYRHNQPLLLYPNRNRAIGEPTRVLFDRNHGPSHALVLSPQHPERRPQLVHRDRLTRDYETEERNRPYNRFSYYDEVITSTTATTADEASFYALLQQSLSRVTRAPTYQFTWLLHDEPPPPPFEELPPETLVQRTRDGQLGYVKPLDDAEQRLFPNRHKVLFNGDDSPVYLPDRLIRILAKPDAPSIKDLVCPPNS